MPWEINSGACAPDQRRKHMKYIKMLGLAAVAAAALMAFVGAGSASAAELTCNGSPCAIGATIHSVSEGKAVLDAPFGNVECESTVHGEVTKNGEAGKPAVGQITETPGPNTGLNWTNCGGDTVTTLKAGTLSIESSGEVKSSGARVTVVHLGVHCIFETSNTKVGTLSGGTTAKLTISATIPRVGGSGGVFCGSSAPWTGSYMVNTPHTLTVH
jgi:hypothetical protein